VIPVAATPRKCLRCYSRAPGVNGVAFRASGVAANPPACLIAVRVWVSARRISTYGTYRNVRRFKSLKQFVRQRKEFPCDASGIGCGRARAGFSLIQRQARLPVPVAAAPGWRSGFPAAPLPYPGDSDVRAGCAAPPQPPVAVLGQPSAPRGGRAHHAGRRPGLPARARTDALAEAAAARHTLGA
jgi:hypothetical protein